MTLWRKDFRQLFWPWCFLMAAALLSFWTQRLEHLPGPMQLLVAAMPLSAFIGLPLLASLALGTEFQYRTLNLTLAQPLDRRALWLEKTMVSWAGVTIPLVLFCFAIYLKQGRDIGVWFMLACLANAIMATSALMFWTLMARGIIGGLALCVLSQTSIYLLLLKFAEQNHNYRVMFDLPGRYSPEFVVGSATALLSYSALMVWLGRRSLLRYQATEGTAEIDMLSTNLSLGPAWLASFLAPQPRKLILNLVRREIYLQRPVWLLTVPSAAGWMFVSAFHIIPPHAPGGEISISGLTAIALLSILGVMIAVIAGAAPVGEERNLGTHAIHMTLPLSARVQWLVKLAVALVTGGVCAGMMPVLILNTVGFLQGSATRSAWTQPLWEYALAGTCISLLAFWCACCTNATVKAILWTFPVGVSLLIAASAGSWLGETLAAGPVPGGLAHWIFRYVDPFNLPDWVSPYGLIRRVSPVVFLTPALFFALLQTYRVFRRDSSERNPLIRKLLPVIGIAFVLGAVPVCTEWLAISAFVQQKKLAREIHPGLEKLLTEDIAKNGEGHTLHMTAEDLASATPLSDDTRRWLGSADISVVSKFGAWGQEFRYSWLYGGQPVSAQSAPTQYLATISRSRGPGCVLVYTTFPGRRFVDGQFVESKIGSVHARCKP